MRIKRTEKENSEKQVKATGFFKDKKDSLLNSKFLN